MRRGCTRVSSAPHVHYRSYPRTHSRRRSADPHARQAVAGHRHAGHRHCPACSGTAGSRTGAAGARGRGRRGAGLRPVWPHHLHRPRSLAPRRAAAQSRRRPRQCGLALRAGGRRTDTTASRRMCSSPRAGWPTAIATRSAAPRCSAWCCCRLKDHAGAREVLERAISRHGENAYLLANLARVYAALGDEERADALIWRALELDPNEATSLNWLIANLSGKQGQQAAIEAYARAAVFPGSWRPQLWLARDALARGDLAEATRLYEEALGRVQPAPADLLMQLSGDLGNRGHTDLLVTPDAAAFRPGDARSHGGQQPAACLRRTRQVRRRAQAARTALCAAAARLARAAQCPGSRSSMTRRSVMEKSRHPSTSC